jgi:hypothetical protein
LTGILTARRVVALPLAVVSGSVDSTAMCGVEVAKYLDSEIEPPSLELSHLLLNSAEYN